MNGENKFLAMLMCISLIVLAVLGIVLLVALWQYRFLVGWLLLGIVVFVVVALVVTACMHSFNEQALRHKRYHHQYETLITPDGVPYTPSTPVAHSSYEAGYQSQRGMYDSEV